MGRARSKRSVTLEPEVAEAVDRHVESGAVESFSAAINEAAARWAANQDLREALEVVYSEHPDARPTHDEVAAAADALEVRPAGPR